MARKLTLDINSLTVDTFEIETHAGRKGTVQGQQETYGWATCMMTANTCTIQNTNQENCNVESVGLSACCHTTACTMDPIAVDCYVSDIYCSAVPEGCVYTIDSFCTEVASCGN